MIFVKVGYKIKNFKFTTNLESVSVIVDLINSKLNNLKLKDKSKTFPYTNFDSKRYITMYIMDDAKLGIFLLDHDKIILEADFNDSETQLFLSRLLLLIDDVEKDAYLKSVPIKIVTQWIEILGHNLDDLRQMQVVNYIRSKYGNASINMISVQKEMTTWANSVPDLTVNEFYKENDVRTFLRAYLALCFAKVIEPIDEDKDYFRKY